MEYVIFGNGFEEIEAVTPVDLLKRAGADVITVGIGSREITGSHQMVIKTDITDSEMQTDGMEMIVLPGGLGGTATIQNSDSVKEVVRYAYDHDLWVCAICAAPTVLGSMGLLNGKRAICYPGHEEQLRGAEIVPADVVVDGKIITGRAAGASIPFSLKLIEALFGREASEAVREKIVYTACK